MLNISAKYLWLGMKCTYRTCDIGVTRDTNLGVVASAFISLLQVTYIFFLYVAISCELFAISRSRIV